LIGSIAGLGLLARNNELTVIRAAGVPLKRIAWSVMKIGIVLVIIVTVIGEWIAPRSEHQAQVLRSVAMSENISLKTKNGLWARDGKSFVNVREILPDGRLSGIYIYDFEDNTRLQQMTFAGHAVYFNERWLLRDVTRHRVSTDGTTSVSIEQEPWDTRLSPDLLNVVIVKPDTLSATGLRDYVAYLRANGLNAERYEVALWSKIAAPFVTGVMVFLALPFVFGPLRSVTAGQRIVFGSLLGTGFYLINQVTIYVTLVFAFNPMVGALLPALMFSALAVFLMRRVF
jgi:lipopolysaccharide export system permease protein